MEGGMKNCGKKWDDTSPAIKMKEKLVREDMLHLQQQVEKEGGDINISENTVKYRDWENRIANSMKI
jgi:hypothetical protein